MRYSTVIIFLLFSLNAAAQVVEKYYDYKWDETDVENARFYSKVIRTDSGYTSHDYYLSGGVLQMVGKYKDAETRIKDGYFFYFHPNGVLSSCGRYINGKREGLWLDYHHSGALLDSSVYSNDHIIGTSMGWYPNGFLRDSIVINAEGSGTRVHWFDNGNLESAGFVVNHIKPDKIWKYYHKNGQPSSVEKYNRGILENKSYYDENGIILADTTNKDREPEFPGGIEAWKRFLTKKAYFPDEYKIVNADRVVIVIEFTVNEDGSVEDVTIATPFDPRFDQIVKKAIAASPKWSPAVNHNRKVKFLWKQPFVFAQNRD